MNRELPIPPTPYETWFLKEYRFGKIHGALHTLLRDAFEAGRQYEQKQQRADAQGETS